MTQWLRKKIISVMGNVYVWLDKGLVHHTSPILGIDIDDDLQAKSRRELCQHIEDKFGWDRDSFWSLESTQKIRLCCQTARDLTANAIVFNENTSEYGVWKEGLFFPLDGEE
jgi:hypothetical protein|tara:strand:+ start:280 stop:615 length:336 start_codon:yes stop_codon:yes gene_type:complete